MNSADTVQSVARDEVILFPRLIQEHGQTSQFQSRARRCPRQPSSQYQNTLSSAINSTPTPTHNNSHISPTTFIADRCSLLNLLRSCLVRSDLRTPFNPSASAFFYPRYETRHSSRTKPCINIGCPSMPSPHRAIAILRTTHPCL